MPEAKHDTNDDEDEVAKQTLFRLTRGLPRHELNLMIAEANACEAELVKEIEMLEKGDGIEEILATPLTPLEKCWTVSSLLGRLRGEIAVPSILRTDGSRLLPNTTTMKESAALNAMTKHPDYIKTPADPSQLLACWKKIHNHRAAAVFKKAVKPDEAPGYTDRIKFPMDLGLIRKMIVANKIRSFAELHQYMGLISHNCVKYNGRESDYGIVAREFEAVVDDYVRYAVVSGGRITPKAASPVPAAVESAAVATEAPKSAPVAASAEKIKS